MSNRVWLCNVHRNSMAGRAFRPLSAEPGRFDDPASVAFIALIQKLTRHEAVLDEDLPDALCIMAGSRDHRKSKRHMMIAGGVMVVSEESAAVLSAHDLGQTRLRPVQLLLQDKTTPLGGNWFYLVPGNPKPALRGEASTGLHHYPGTDLYMPLNTDLIEPDGIVLDSRAKEGADLWFDPAIYFAPLLSDRLAQSLKAAKLAKHWELIPCWVE